MIEAVMDICTPTQQDLINFILETGARINEALNIKGRDIGSTHANLYTRKSNYSNSVPRKVPKPDWLDKKLFTADERVFKEWNEYPKFLDRKVRQLKQHRWGFHSLRHRRASLWSKEGKPFFKLLAPNLPAVGVVGKPLAGSKMFVYSNLLNLEHTSCKLSGHVNIVIIH